MKGSLTTVATVTQVRSTTSYYQVAVNLPATYYGNVTVSLTVRHMLPTLSKPQFCGRWQSATCGQSSARHMSLLQAGMHATSALLGPCIINALMLGALHSFQRACAA